MPETEPWEYTLYIPNDVRAVTVSRRTLRLILTLHGLIGLADTAELLATELIANAVRHTKGPAALRCAGRPGCCGSERGTRIPNRRSRPRSWSSSRSGRRGEDWPWSGRVPTCGAGSR